MPESSEQNRATSLLLLCREIPTRILNHKGNRLPDLSIIGPKAKRLAKLLGYENAPVTIERTGEPPTQLEILNLHDALSGRTWSPMTSRRESLRDDGLVKELTATLPTAAADIEEWLATWERALTSNLSAVPAEDCEHSPGAPTLSDYCMTRQEAEHCKNLTAETNAMMAGVPVWDLRHLSGTQSIPAIADSLAGRSMRIVHLNLTCPVSQAAEEHEPTRSFRGRAYSTSRLKQIPRCCVPTPSILTGCQSGRGSSRLEYERWNR